MVGLDWYQTVFELIDMRSFSNLWYWIALAVVWSTAAHWVLGVPFDMVQRAARQGGQAEVDLEDMVRINVNRLNYIVEYAGIWLLAITCLAYTAMPILGFVYGLEFAQAVFLLTFPMVFIAGLNIFTARKIQRDEVKGEDLRRRMSRHRLITQGIGVLSIFITAFYGMLQNLTVIPFAS